RACDHARRPLPYHAAGWSFGTCVRREIPGLLPMAAQGPAAAMVLSHLWPRRPRAPCAHTVAALHHRALSRHARRRLRHRLPGSPTGALKVVPKRECDRRAHHIDHAVGAADVDVDQSFETRHRLRRAADRGAEELVLDAPEELRSETYLDA